MSGYIVICQKPDGSVEVAAHPGEASPELLQDAQQASDMDEALQLARDVLGQAGQGAEPSVDTPNAGNDAPADEEYGAAAPSGAEGMPMESEEDQMAAGFKRANKGY